MKEILKTTLGLILLLNVFFIVMSIVYLIVFILGIEPDKSFLEFVKLYFYSGNFFIISAWRVHILVILVCFVMSILNYYE